VASSAPVITASSATRSKDVLCMDREVGVVGRVDPAIHKIGMAELTRLMERWLARGFVT